MLATSYHYPRCLPWIISTLLATSVAAATFPLTSATLLVAATASSSGRTIAAVATGRGAVAAVDGDGNGATAGGTGGAVFSGPRQFQTQLWRCAHTGHRVTAAAVSSWNRRVRYNSLQRPWPSWNRRVRYNSLQRPCHSWNRRVGYNSLQRPCPPETDVYDTVAYSGRVLLKQTCVIQ